MQKIRVLTHLSDVDEVLAVVQRYGAAEFHEVAVADTNKLSGEFAYADLLPRVQHAVSYLAPFAPKVGMLKTLREGTQVELKEADIDAKLRDTDALSLIIEDIDKVQVEQAELTERVRSLEEDRAVLACWKDLPFRLADLETAKTKTLLLTSDDKSVVLGDVLREALSEKELPFSLEVLDSRTVALTYMKEATDVEVVKNTLNQLDVEVATIPNGEEEPSIELVRVEQELADAKGKLGLVYDQAEHFAITHLKNLQVAAELLSWKREAHAVKDLGVSTKRTALFEGWINANKRTLIEEDLTARTLAATIEEVALAPEEEPPVEIENSKWVQPFEVVTRLYGMPGHRDLDPTAFLAGFFFLFFGLSLTDVGYGVFLMTIAGSLLLFAKLSKVVRVFAKLLFMMGLASALVGLLFGGYLGIAPESLPSWLVAIQLFDPIGNPLPVFYLALALGVFQIMVGMLLKIYSEARNGQLLTGLLDQGPWFVMFCILIAYLANSLGYLTIVSADQLINLVYVGVVAIVVASGRKGDTILQKVQSAALSLYDSIGYFSDILSYSRLLALGLATTALAFAVNLIADIVRESVPVIGPIFAILVLIIGHLFTLAVNTLGAFIHSARLQFVEFFGKFIAGTGRQFTPLSRTEKHIAINDE
jgi:V/A-type H+-transporting ATPase subunit I